MAITMTLNQIKKEFEEAKNPIAQIDILADLNQTTREEIIIALKTAGVDARKLPRNRKAKEEPVVEEPVVEEPVVEEPVVEEPVVEEPVAEEPVAEKPAQKKAPEKRPALVPRDLFEVRRMIDLLEGIQSALDHKENVPPEYVKELDAIFFNFKRRREKQ